MSPLDDAFCAAYPTVIDALIEVSDHPTRVSLWGVSQALHDRLNRDFYRTFHFGCGAFTTGSPEYHTIPPSNCSQHHQPTFPGLESNLERYCRLFEVEGNCKRKLAIKLFAAARNVTALRLPSSINSEQFTPLPSTLIIKTHCDAQLLSSRSWRAGVVMMPKSTPHGPMRLVINCRYAWADQLFASHLGLETIPSSVTELVIHFKCFEIKGKRPRYWLCRAIADDDGGGVEYVKELSPWDPVPDLEDGGYLRIIRFPVRSHDLGNVFNDIAKLYAQAIGEDEYGPVLNLKLTIVGLDEFHASRAADAADDDFFASMIDSLPWGAEGPPAPSRYRRRYYAPIAPKFVDLVAEATHASKRSAVKENVRVLTREQYFAELGAVRRMEEDYWFRAESDGM